MDQIKINTICILRLSAIGDVCHAVAAVQAIQAVHPHASITWIIGKIEHKLLEGLPGVDFIKLHFAPISPPKLFLQNEKLVMTGSEQKSSTPYLQMTESKLKPKRTS